MWYNHRHILYAHGYNQGVWLCLKCGWNRSCATYFWDWATPLLWMKFNTIYSARFQIQSAPNMSSTRNTPTKQGIVQPWTWWCLPQNDSHHWLKFEHFSPSSCVSAALELQNDKARNVAGWISSILWLMGMVVISIILTQLGALYGWSWWLEMSFVQKL